jgi:DNA-binding phage protein
MKLQTWIEENGGVVVIAQKLNVKQRTIYYWIHRKVHPRVEMILKIVKLSRGALTIEDVVRSTMKEMKGN